MKIVCLGDSNTYGYDPRGYFGDRYDAPWPELLADATGWDVVNSGVNGMEIPLGKHHIPTECDLLIIMLGTNDLLQLRLPEDAAERMERFISGFSEDECKKLLLIAPPPMKFGEWVQDDSLIEDNLTLAAAYEALAQRHQIRYLDPAKWGLSLAYDGVHLTEEDHRVFASVLMDHLNKGE